MLDRDVDIDLSEIEDAFDNIKFVNTVYNKKTVALDVIVTDDNAPIFKLESTFVDDNASIKLAPTTEDGKFDESEGIAYIERTVENGNEKFVFGFKEDGEDEKLLEFNGTYANGKHDGILKTYIDGEEAEIKLSLEIGKGRFKLAISEITIKEVALTTINEIKFNFDFVIDSTFSASAANLEISLKANIEGMANIDAKIYTSYEITNVSITAPTTSVKFDELDENALFGWITTLATKYPNIMGFVSNLMYQENEPNNDLNDFDDYDDFDDFEDEDDDF
jgi:hypothetical protein